MVKILSLEDYKKRNTAEELDAFLASFTDMPGCLFKRGTRVTKTECAPGDAHKPGDFGTVVGSIDDSKPNQRRFGYFVIWDDFPGIPVFVTEERLCTEEDFHRRTATDGEA